MLHLRTLLVASGNCVMCAETGAGVEMRNLSLGVGFEWSRSGTKGLGSMRLEWRNLLTWLHEKLKESDCSPAIVRKPIVRPGSRPCAGEAPDLGHAKIIFLSVGIAFAAVLFRTASEFTTSAAGRSSRKKWPTLKHHEKNLKQISRLRFN